MFVACGMFVWCAKQVVYITVQVCHFPYSVLSAESSREKERGEFSMLSTVDMCAACCLQCGQYWRSKGQTEQHAEFPWNVSHCFTSYVSEHF